MPWRFSAARKPVGPSSAGTLRGPDDAALDEADERIVERDHP